MQSPFPGMDPYIEVSNLWGDFHINLITEIQRFLAGSLPERYLVRSEQRSYIVLAEEEGKKEHKMVPDVKVTAPPGRKPSAATTAVAELATDEDCVSMDAFVVDEYRESFIEIYEVGDDRQLITVIEVLSPSNKRPGTPGWDLYKRKRDSLLMGGANFVEIDLIRGGQKMPMLQPWPDSPYTILVSRRWLAPSCKVFLGWSVKPLPAVRVPLLRPDSDVSLGIQPFIDAIYARNRYHHSIEYSKPLPLLTEPETTFLADQIRTRAPKA